MDMINSDDGPSWAMAVHLRLAEKRLGEHASASRSEEFEQLVSSCDCKLIVSEKIVVRKLVPATLIGSGQAEAIARLVEENEVDVVFVDHSLTPAQQQNLETAWNAKVVDRTGLILEIFGSRARTKEGILQVGLASLNYQLGRLVGSWTHLERQRGGHGFMGGPGERQIELDRRMIRNTIQRLERELKLVRRMRSTQRAGRDRSDIPTVALVGYTNAGKSTLFNRLTKADVFASDQLFATLDPTLRKMHLPGGEAIMLSDTVGFVQDLPHELVNAFRATLEEVVEADLILHVRDASDPESSMHKAVVLETLQELGVDGDDAPPMVEVLNKIDRAAEVKSRILEGQTDGSRVALSALKGEGVDELLLLLRQWVETDRVACCLKLDMADGKTLAWCHEFGRVLQQQVIDEKCMHVTVLLPDRYVSMLCDGPAEEEF